MSPTLVNAPAPNVPYFTPAQIPAAGAAVNPQSSGKPIPKLFQPLKIRGVEFQNRVWVRIFSLLAVVCSSNQHKRVLYLIACSSLPILCQQRLPYRMAYGTPYVFLFTYLDDVY